MEERTVVPERKLTRSEISAAITDLGWRLILGAARTHVRVGSLAQAVSVAGNVIDAAGADAEESLRADLRADRVILTLQSRRTGWVSQRELDGAQRISAAVRDLGLATDPGTGTGAGTGTGTGTGTDPGQAGATRSAQIMEIA